MSSRRLVLPIVVLAAILVGCSGDGDSAATTAPDVTICDPDGTAQAEADLPAVGRISEAIEALEQQLGAPQQYFEVNATARVVNLFVALNNATLAQAWLYLDGEFTSQEAQAASGGTFGADAVAFDPERVLTRVRTEVPEAVIESFYVHGDGKGNVQYGVLASALCGGGLDVVVGPDGSVKSVDPV
ncbi:MAG: hypothetical protein RI900_262 [Actinomycetota bacterium]|jgi:hypothetical protein